MGQDQAPCGTAKPGSAGGGGEQERCLALLRLTPAPCVLGAEKKGYFWAQNAHVWSPAKGDVFVGGGNLSKFLP